MQFLAPIFAARDYLAAQLNRIGDSFRAIADDLDTRLALPAPEADQAVETTGKPKRIAGERRSS